MIVSFHIVLHENNGLRHFFHTKGAPFPFRNLSPYSDKCTVSVTYDRCYAPSAVGDLKRPNEKVKSPEDAGSIQVEPPYTIFKKSEKLSTILLVAFASAFSPLNSWIYFPALTTVANDLHSVMPKINLTISSYTIASAVAPMLMGSIDDQVGRRPVYLITLLP